MTGKELSKLLRCIREKKGLKWTTGSLCQRSDNGEVSYCALGLIAKAAGVPDWELVHKGRPRWWDGHGPDYAKVYYEVPSTNDTSDTFEEMCERFENWSDAGPIEDYIQSCKDYAKSLGVKEEDCEG